MSAIDTAANHGYSSACPYKVRARGLAEWKSYDSVRLEISVGQDYHEGAKLKASLDWARDNFGRVTLIIGDLPQRYNWMFENRIDEDEATKRALLAGDQWLARNNVILNEGKKIDIRRWGYWRDTENYIYRRWQVGRLYRNNENFRKAIQDAIGETWARRVEKQGYDVARKSEFFKNSTDYLLEETTVFSLAYEQFPGVSAYPGSFLEMWSMFISEDVPGAPLGLRNAHCLRLSFLKQ